LPTWDITTWIAVGASALATLLLAALVVLALRLLRGGDAAARSRRELDEAWDEVKRERAASARARSELHWLRHLADVAPADSLECSLRRVLESAAGLGDCAAAMLVLPQDEGKPLVATYGLSPEESGRELLGLPAGGTEARAVSLAYRYSAEEEVRDEFRLRRGLALPVGGDNGGRLGTLGVFWRRREREVTDGELERLEGLAAALGPSLRNVVRFEQLRQAVDCDATGLPGRRRLQGALAAECARSRRYAHPLSLVLLRTSADAEAVEQAAARLPEDVRSPDLVHHLGHGRFAVVLPESSLADAEQLARRLRLALGEGRMPFALEELRSEDDAVSLLERAEAGLGDAEQLVEAGRTRSNVVEPSVREV
jgi:GGDEF domain-containing protein